MMDGGWLLVSGHSRLSEQARVPIINQEARISRAQRSFADVMNRLRFKKFESVSERRSRAGVEVRVSTYDAGTSVIRRRMVSHPSKLLRS